MTIAAARLHGRDAHATRKQHGRAARATFLLLLLLACAALEGTTRPARPDVPPSFALHTSPRFHLWTDAGDTAARTYLHHAESTADALCEAAKKIGLAAPLPKGPLTLVIFTSREAFEKHLRDAQGGHASWSAGHYSPETRIVTLCQDAKPGDAVARQLAINAARHEIAHQLLDVTGVVPPDAPAWLAEGMAILFEEPGGPEKPNAHRLRTLQLAEDAGRPLDVRKLLSTTPADDEAPERVAEFYSQAWLLAHYLWNRRPADLKAYLKTLVSSPDAHPVRLFQKHFGDELDQLQRTLDAHLRALRAEKNAGAA